MDINSDRPTQIPVLKPGHTFASVTDKISHLVLTRKTPRYWWLGFGISFLLANALFGTAALIILKGVGLWGVNVPVGWGFDIINFVWWIGIGHAGTLISAILLLLRQNWRTSINRFAEAMTLFAVANAALFPLLHMGRHAYFYFTMPYPNRLGMWPNFRSPLVWDLFAISTYATVSALFWYLGLIPDLATLRDRAKSKIWQMAYGALAMGWRGSARHWRRYQTAYFLMAALATPLVVSVHSIVGMDFAFSVIPGWHSTVFPPYFVAGAVFSGFAMVMTLAIPLRKLYDLEDFITDRHLDNMAKVMLAMGLIVAYGYMMETFAAWYSADQYEAYNLADRFTGSYAPIYWLLLLCNVLIPQLLWSWKIRHNTLVLFLISIAINLGMWSERFIIIVQSLSRDYLPSSWHNYTPTIFDWSTFIGTIGLFLALMFLFLRFLPAISIFEMRELVHEEDERLEEEAGGHHPAAPSPTPGD